MTEGDYIRVTNKANVVAAAALLRGVTPKYSAIDEDDYKKMMELLYQFESKCFKCIDTTD